MSFLLSFMRPLYECILVSSFKRKVKVESRAIQKFYHFSLFIIQPHEGIVCMLPFLINSTLLSGHIILGIQWIFLLGMDVGNLDFWVILLKTPQDFALSGYILTCHQLNADDISVCIRLAG